jgi:IclR family acetate operon transcriptional repressor
VAAPIRDTHGRPEAAVSVSAPIHRLPEEKRPRLGGLVAEVASRVTLP